MKSLLSKRESDVVRLREQRDQQHAELNERKQKDSVKQYSKQELRNLAESHAVSLALSNHLTDQRVHSIFSLPRNAPKVLNLRLLD